MQRLDGHVVAGDSGYRGTTSIATPRREYAGLIIRDDHYRAHRRIRARVEHIIAGLWNLKTRNQLQATS